MLETFERVYPFAWLGILAAAPPSSAELIYARHERGFALHSMRSPELTRLYLQCDPDEDLAPRPHQRIRRELQLRLGSSRAPLNEGGILQKGPVACAGIGRTIIPGRVELIEVIKGAASALYGTSALGGVVNLIS